MLPQKLPLDWSTIRVAKGFLDKNDFGSVSAILAPYRLGEEEAKNLVGLIKGSEDGGLASKLPLA